MNFANVHFGGIAFIFQRGSVSKYSTAFFLFGLVPLMRAAAAFFAVFAPPSNDAPFRRSFSSGELIIAAAEANEANDASFFFIR